jgi:inosine/xanthosine triphosphatase
MAAEEISKGMKRVIVASQNPIKLQATLAGFQRMFPDEQFAVEGISVESGVSDQPSSDTETYQGAANRVENAHRATPEADFWVGLEGGIEVKNGDMESFAWMVVCGPHDLVGKGRTATFFLPPRVAELIKEGKELGEADDIVFGKTNSKQANGAVGLLTGDVIVRAGYYTEAVIFALIPFKNTGLYITPES